MIVGIVVLAAVAFILSLTILFTYQINKRQRSRNCREGNVQSEDLNNVYRETFFNSVFPEQTHPNQSLIKNMSFSFQLTL